MKTEFKPIEVVALVHRIFHNRAKFSAASLNWYKVEGIIEPHGENETPYSNYYTLLDISLLCFLIRLKQLGISIGSVQWALSDIRDQLEQAFTWNHAFITVSHGRAIIEETLDEERAKELARAHELSLIYDVSSLLRFVLEAARQMKYESKGYDHTLSRRQVAV